MSPEPVAIITNTTVSNIGGLDNGDPSREMIELRVQLDRERRLRMHLEDQVRSLESQLYPERIREITQQVQLQYHHQEVLEHSSPTVTVTASSQRCRSESQPPLPTQTSTQPVGSSNSLVPVSLLQETAAAVAQLQVVSAASLPPVAQNTTIVSTSPLRLSPTPPPASPTPVVPESPCPSPPAPVSPQPEQRLPSVLEAAIKAEPKVEVERLPSPTSASDDVTPQARLYLASTSRQNLETIVEAIRHLEGDHLFSDDPSPRGQQQHLSSSIMDEPAQEVPLALTTHNKTVTQSTQTQVAHRLLKVEMNPFLQFHSTPQSTQQRVALQQQRPGVIVVKQHT
ncbi:hypothetical protein B7P43_G08751 [Cryptotermes secundus]|uniref:Uncharacterized protein n=2 Tax=Cryptotermes secundus TaxID=105785 RepID=A0A2J7RNU7_9NEOP|nr:hypothetical protein B7P43_G08751 [Cryptotermes secundus]